MCLLITAFAAIVCYLLQKVIRFDISRLTMMFTSATIMWLVDCSFAKFDGKDFFDISYDDTLLKKARNIACLFVTLCFLPCRACRRV